MYSYTITGTVTDQKDGAPVAGANVTLLDSKQGAATSEQGRFHLNNVPTGTYTLAVSHISYRVYKQQITVDENLQLSIDMQPQVLKGQQIQVVSNRAVERKSPVAFTDISAQEIEREYFSQEVPLLLDKVPGVYSYSNTGGPIGYSEIKIRGFDATRVGVTINGVPLNDPQDHITYFYDLPDISANLEDIQVQRGVANSLYGTAAFAGTVNLKTSTAADERKIQYTAGFGSYNTRKHTVSLNSGLVNNTYTFHGRFSKISTDGYRDKSWVDAWSYFFSASRYDENVKTTINLFGGPMQAHFAWNGITRERLKTDRTYNSYQYEDAKDSFHQPHYQLINEWTPLDNLAIESTLFFIKGDGYYEQYKTGKSLTDYNMHSAEIDGETVTETDLVEQKWVDKQQFGWIPQVHTNWREHDLTIGGEFSTFTSKHWGEVKWGNRLPSDVPPNHVYYRHNGAKQSFALFFNDLYSITPSLFLKFDLQYKHLYTDFDQKKMGAFPGHEYDLTYDFLTPRLGVNYNINQALNVFVNASMANREPKDSDIYDANDPDAAPLFRTMNLEKGVYKDPYIEAETLRDYELGWGYQTTRLRMKFNAFWMDFDNEIVPTGGITDDGYPIYGNADRSRHRGIEFDARAYISGDVTLAGNFTWSDNTFIDYTEYLWNDDYTGYDAYSRDGNTISGFPETMVNLSASRTFGPLYLSVHGQHIGRIYLDNSETEQLSITPYNVVNATARLQLPEFSGVNLLLSVHVNNVLNEKYEVSGYAWGGSGYYIPAALRNVFVSLKTTL
ncbi:MAG: TonB-dependent receptor [candidate division KSB1 bacterium]|nr:TonB-dependent receptor [candidate division KSB1 bacterium]